MSLVAFFDLEVNPEKKKILDIGAIRSDETSFHKNQLREFIEFVKDADFFVGHNIFAHDLKYLQQEIGDVEFGLTKAIDTLLLSPLLFPKNPNHLLKDDKLQTEELNNPLNDAKKAKDLFYDEVNAFFQLPVELKSILFRLLYENREFKNFFKFINFTESSTEDLEIFIRNVFKDRICDNSGVDIFINQNPVALALLNCNDRYSITPFWVLRNHPQVERILFLQRNNPCVTGCEYCNKSLNPHIALKRHFGLPSFRSYGNEPLQENAVKAAFLSGTNMALPLFL